MDYKHIFLATSYFYPSTIRPPIFLPVHNIFYPSTIFCTSPNDGWTGLCIKPYVTMTQKNIRLKQDSAQQPKTSKLHCFFRQTPATASKIESIHTYSIGIQRYSHHPPLKKYLMSTGSWPVAYFVVSSMSTQSPLLLQLKSNIQI